MANPRGEATPRRPVVLLRLERVAHGAARAWAHAAARACESGVVVVRLVNRPRGRTNIVSPDRNLADGLLEVSQAEHLMRARARWNSFLGGNHAPPVLSVVNLGLNHLAEALEGVEPGLVVMPASRFWPEESVLGLATILGVPVLVTRALGGLPRMVVASNLEDPRRPVLRVAAQWGERLGLQLTFVHNLTPIVLPQPGPGALSFSAIDAGVEQELAQHQVQKLEQLATDFAADASVTRSGDSATGILQVARSTGASLVVVGVRHRSESRSHRVPKQVLARATQSVLVVPVAHREPGSLAPPRAFEVEK